MRDKKIDMLLKNPTLFKSRLEALYGIPVTFEFIFRFGDKVYCYEDVAEDGKIEKASMFLLVALAGFVLIERYGGRWVQSNHGLGVDLENLRIYVHLSKKVNKSRKYEFGRWLYCLVDYSDCYKDNGILFPKNFDCISFK